MKSTDDLYQLVHSLTPAEKRYVKVFASKHLIGSNNNYLRLFDSLAAMEEYDEEELKRKFKGKSFIKHLPSEKNYLHKFILKSMRSYHAESSVDTLLKELLVDAKYLSEKRLYLQCEKVLDKAKKIAALHNKYHVLLEILLMERVMIVEHHTRDVKEKINKVDNETLDIIQQLSAFYQLFILRDSIFVLTRGKYHLREPDLAKETEDIMDHPLLQELGIDFNQQWIYYFTHAVYSIFNGRYQEADKWYNHLIDLWEKHPHRIKEEGYQYKKILSNYLSNCQALGKLNEFPRILGKIRAIPCKNLDEEAEEFQNVYYMELLHLMNTNALDKAEALVPEIEKGMKTYQAKINKARELAFYHNIAVLFFVQEKNKKALEWVNRIVNDEKSESRMDIQDFARVFQLILYYELDKTDLMEYAWRSAHRYFKQRESTYTFELLILEYLKKLAKANEEKKQPLYRLLHDQLLHLVSDPSHKKAQGFDEALYWVKSKVLNKTLAALVAEA